jgi:putative transposase
VKKRFSEEQIVGILREAEAGVAIKELCRKHGFSEASYYAWRSKYGGMEVSDVRRLKSLDTENARLKRLLAEAMLENEVITEALRKNGNRTGPSGLGAVDADEGTGATPSA